MNLSFSLSILKPGPQSSGRRSGNGTPACFIRSLAQFDRWPSACQKLLTSLRSSNECEEDMENYTPQKWLAALSDRFALGLTEAAAGESQKFMNGSHVSIEGCSIFNARNILCEWASGAGHHRAES